MTVAAPAIQPLLTVSSLRELLDDVIIVDTRRPEHHTAGHIPGAISVPLRTALMEDTTQPALTALGRQAQEALAARGLSPADPIVMVDDGDGSACVAVHIAELAGCSNVGALFGGMDEWRRTGGDLETGPDSAQPGSFEAALEFRTVASIEDVQYAPHNGGTLVDVRSQLEHEGIIGSPCCPTRGHIPGSLHLEWTSLLTASGQLAEPDSIRADLLQIGLNTADDVIVYCHSGMRSAVAALILRDAGFTRVRNAIGSWHEWSHRGLPIAPTL